MKKCSRCCLEKPLDDFYTDKRIKKDGHTALCKDCQHDYERNKRKALREERARAKEAAHRPGFKTCTKCGLEKPMDEFGLRRTKGNRPRARCKTCECLETTARRDRMISDPDGVSREREKNAAYRKANWRKVRDRNKFGKIGRKFGLNKAAYDSLIARCGNACEICGVTFTRTPCLDHCHSISPPQVRGVLCFECNTAIGLFKERKDLLLKAASYLDR